MNKHVETIQEDFSTHDTLKVGVVSDTHSYIDPIILQHLSDCKVILHAGDIGSIQVINQLKHINHNVISVRGNNDIIEKWSAEEHTDLEKIPELAEIKLPGGSIALMHGDKYHSVATRHEKMREHFSTAKAIVYGHSHELVCDQSDTPWVLNPGAAGKSHTKGGATCLLVFTNQVRWEVIEVRVEKTI